MRRLKCVTLLVSAADAVRIKQSTVRMSTNPVWVGDPELMTCVATPSGVTATKASTCVYFRVFHFRTS